jgi:hypothetical protein
MIFCNHTLVERLLRDGGLFLVLTSRVKTGLM